MSASLVCWGRFLDRDGQKVTVPAPSTDAGAPWLWDFLAAEAHDLARIGFRRLQLPPAGKAQGGAGPGCDGYGLYDPRDLGAKPQQGSTPTRYGSVDSLRRLVAVAHSNGLSVDLDIVLHQLVGGDSGTYRYLGADGKTLNARGPMHPGCFRRTPGGIGTQAEDDVPSPRDDSSFGDEKVYQHSSPPGYTLADALDYGHWLFNSTGADGARIDDVKGLWPPFIAAFMRHGAMASKSFYAEYFDGNPEPLNAWSTGPPIQSRSAVEDFPLHFALQNACNHFTTEGLESAGFAARNPGLSYGFVENPDTDLSDGMQVVSNKLLAYAFLLTIPCANALIYGKDYFPSSIWPGAYGLKPALDNLIYIHQTFAFGKLTTRWIDARVIVLERDGDGGSMGRSAGLLTAINFDPATARTITCLTAFGPNAHLHDYTGHHPDIWTNPQAEASFTIPANTGAAGTSFLCFSRPGAAAPIPIQPRRTSQVFSGAADLDIPPARPGAPHPIARIHVAAGTPVHLAAPTSVKAFLLDGTTPVLSNKPPRTGWYTLAVSGNAPGDTPFDLTVTYEAPQTI